jgi:hypothetical protein
MLIYAQGERPEATYTVRHAGKTLDFVTLSLEGEPDAILGQIDAVASRIRELRRRGLAATPTFAFTPTHREQRTLPDARPAG